MRISDIFQKFTRNSCGFTLLEVAVGLSILSMGVGLIGTSVFQVLSIQRHWQDDRVATKDLRHIGSWFAGDALNAETVVFGGTAPAPTVTLSWVDSSDPLDPQFHSSVYGLNGGTLTRNNDGIVILCRAMGSSSWLTGRGGGVEPMQYIGWHRVADLKHEVRLFEAHVPTVKVLVVEQL